VRYLASVGGGALDLGWLGTIQRGAKVGIQFYSV